MADATTGKRFLWQISRVWRLVFICKFNMMCISCVIITELLGSSTSDRRSPQNMPRSKLFSRLIERYWLSWREGTSNSRTQREYGIMNNGETSWIFKLVYYIYELFSTYITPFWLFRKFLYHSTLWCGGIIMLYKLRYNENENSTIENENGTMKMRTLQQYCTIPS